MFFFFVMGQWTAGRCKSYYIHTQIPAAANASVVCFSEGDGIWHCLVPFILRQGCPRGTPFGTLSIPEGKQTKTLSAFEVYHFKNIAIMMISPLEAQFFLMDIVIVFKSEPEQSHLWVSFFSFLWSVLHWKLNSLAWNEVGSLGTRHATLMSAAGWTPPISITQTA